MKSTHNRSWRKLLFSALMISLVYGCSDSEDTWDAELFEPGTFQASADKDAIARGETITFSDASTKVHTRLWTFPSGVPSSSTEAEVVVTFPKGGDYTARLQVTFVDNTIRTQNFSVAVEGPPGSSEPVITGATYGILSEHQNVPQAAATPIWFINSNAFTNKAYEGADPFEGNYSHSFIVPSGNTQTWAMSLIQAKEGAVVNLSQFASGYLNLALKSTSTGSLRLRIRGTGIDTFIVLPQTGNNYGFTRDGQWHMLSIPMADILTAIPEGERATRLSQVKDLLILRSHDPEDIRTMNNFNFDIDNIYYSEHLPEY